MIIKMAAAWVCLAAAYCFDPTTLNVENFPLISYRAKYQDHPPFNVLTDCSAANTMIGTPDGTLLGAQAELAPFLDQVCQLAQPKQKL